MNKKSNYLHENIHWLMRLIMAYIFFSHGLPKFGKIVANLGYIGFLIGPFEVLGGLLLIIGYFTKEIFTKIGGFMIAIIMSGAIYMHLFKWGDSIADMEYQMILLVVSLYFLVKGNDI